MLLYSSVRCGCCQRQGILELMGLCFDLLLLFFPGFWTVSYTCGSSVCALFNSDIHLSLTCNIIRREGWQWQQSNAVFSSCGGFSSMPHFRGHSSVVCVWRVISSALFRGTSLRRSRECCEQTVGSLPERQKIRLWHLIKQSGIAETCTTHFAPASHDHKQCLEFFEITTPRCSFSFDERISSE